ncbi:hypothetical protein DFH07DRAFT_919850 [Mycena maculata]|uniref:Uncharacterized protein n=1 Tax=Mycena maculata TaxID=230809 RepID=A0AAD7NEE9_9AGAR|nr:hypothetical protein DFH07DRAFT_919850 [Mycena maculata]
MSTMLETYDTHMDSYPIDIDMHQAAEPWFDAEAKMEDDVLLENPFNDHDSSLSVEVDMEDNEYEMADGEGEENYEEMSSDLHDIEVYDASEPLEDATIPPVAPEHLNPTDSHPFDIDSLETAKSLLLPVAATPAMSPLPPPDTELPDASAPEHSEAVVEEHTVEENPSAQQGSDPPVELATPLPGEENVAPVEEFHGHDSGEALEQVETGDAEAPHSEEQQQSSDAVIPDTRDVDESAAVDPHEISEGVYIDPPPAVLVSFESSDFPDVCLFNQPPRSRSPSPSGESHGYQVFTLLLHHHPILYYEPLASVFEALRQEEYLTSIPQFTDSELVLDAYDLQLVISEDNVYAREVTLHDLNVLHDASNITGPLRLGLKLVVPRFILRYHLLQEQVSRLNLVAVGDEQEASDSQTQDHEQSGSIKEQDEEPQPEDVRETTLPAENSAQPANPPSIPAQEYQDGESKEEHKVSASETETSVQRPEGPHEDIEKNAGAEEYAETPEKTGGEGEGEGYGEKLQHEVDDAEAEGVPDLPEEEDEEEEEKEESFVVVQTPGPKPIIPLTGTPAEDTGNEFEQTSVSPLAMSRLHDESGSTNPEPQNREDESEPTADTEDSTGILANNSVDRSVPDDAIYEEESYEEEEETQWEDAVDGDEDPDITWDAEVEHETASNESSVTLSSKASKRSFDEVELEDDEAGGKSPPGSPGAKRTRVD